MINDAPAVLLVEDDRDDEELTLRGLEGAHLNNPVDVARDGQEAVDYLFGTEEQAAERVPALVLLDLKLPRVGGLEVLKRIRAEERTHRVPVVILTSSNDDTDVINGYDSRRQQLRVQADSVRRIRQRDQTARRLLAEHQRTSPAGRRRHTSRQRRLEGWCEKGVLVGACGCWRSAADVPV